MPQYPNIDNTCIYIDAAYNFKDDTRLEFSALYKYCKTGGYIYNYDNEQTSIGRILSDYNNPIYDETNKVNTQYFDYDYAKTLMLNKKNPLCIEFLHLFSFKTPILYKIDLIII